MSETWTIKLQKGNHGPIPWEYRATKSGRIFDADGAPVANSFCAKLGDAPVRSLADQDANAAYIVQACNAFPKLIEACKDLIGCMEQVNRDYPDYLCLGSEYQKARAALKDAEG